MILSRSRPLERRDVGVRVGVLIAGLALAAAIGVGVVSAQLATVGLVVACSVTGAVWRYPKACAGVGTAVILFSQPIEALVPAASLLDELIVICLLCVLTLRRLATVGRLRRIPGQAW